MVLKVDGIKISLYIDKNDVLEKYVIWNGRSMFRVFLEIFGKFI